MKTTTLSMFLFIIKIATTTDEEVVAIEAAYNGKALTANFHLRCACVSWNMCVHKKHDRPLDCLTIYRRHMFFSVSQSVSLTHYSLPL